MPIDPIVIEDCIHCGNPIVWLHLGIRHLDLIPFYEQPCHRKYVEMLKRLEAKNGTP